MFITGVISLAFFFLLHQVYFLFIPDFAEAIVFEYCPGCNSLVCADFSDGPVLVHSHKSAGIRGKKPA
jgi:hypothetical protein